MGFLEQLGCCFTGPSRLLFEQLVTAWVICPGRHTLTRMWALIPAGSRHSYGAYARLLREGKWSMDELWQQLAMILIAGWIANDSVITLLVDDTLFKKTGRKIEGAGWFRDAVHSTASHLVTTWGLNVVVIALCIRPPWGGQPLALPIMVSIRRKGENEMNLIELAVAMIHAITNWLPERLFQVVGDGGYASLIGYQLQRAIVITRLRCDAAIYRRAPQPTGRRGRPKTKGDRLPTPAQIANSVSDWSRQTISLRGKQTEVLLYSQLILWYQVAGSRPLQLVIVRDPARRQRDDFFVTTDITASPAHLAAAYADRWSIEECFRDDKQLLRGEDPQSWTHLAPERVVALSLWLHSAVWNWFAAQAGNSSQPVPDRPWYQHKSAHSFADALAALRRQIWPGIFPTSAPQPDQPEIITALINVLAQAA